MKQVSILLLLALTLSSTAWAHKASDSYLSLSLDETGALSGQWDIALRDLDLLLPLDANNDRRVTWGEVQASGTAIQTLAARSLRLQGDTSACAMDTTSQPLAITTHADGSYVALSLTGKCDGTSSLRVDYRLLDGIDAMHRAIARVRMHGKDQVVVITPGTPTSIGSTHRFTNWRGHVQNGMHHIATGYDHLLFLLSLLLPVALARGGTREDGTPSPWRDTILLVTAFTLAHSLTLALATFQIVQLPSRVVESAIAASVLIAALHNLRAHAPRTRWIMAFVFGLVHGLGFAAMLGDLPTDTAQRLVALAGFNIGVEIGQLMAVAIFLPLAIALARYNRLGYRRWGLQGGSLAIAAMAFVWLCQRLFEWPIIPG